MVSRIAWLILATACSGDKGEDTHPHPDDGVDPPAAPPTDPGLVLECADEQLSTVPATVVGHTLGHGDDTPSTCAADDPRNVDDFAVEFVAPADATYTFTTLRSRTDPIVSVTDGCDGAVLGCSDGGDDKGVVTVPLVAGQKAIVVVDGGDAFQLDVFAVQPTEDCANGLDDDADRLLDCIDPDCTCGAVCPDEVADGAPVHVSSSTWGRSDDYLPKTNVGYVDGPISDTTVAFTAPTAGRYAVAVTGQAFAPHLALLDGCDGRELASTYGTPFALDLAAEQTVILVVDGWYAWPEGAFDVDFYEVADTETSCTDGIDDDLLFGADCHDPACDRDCFEDCTNARDDDGDDAVDCADRTCADAAPCVEAGCVDGVDDDGNGLVDCADPDCDGDPFCAEDCSNRADDDRDGAIDCLDGACTGDPRCAATCPADTLVGTGTVHGRTVGRPDLGTPSCQVGAPIGSDWTVAFTAPDDGRYRFDTLGSTSTGALVVLDGCGGTELGCDAPPFGRGAEVVVELVAGQSVVAMVDTFVERGEFDVNVTGIPAHEADCGDGADDDGDRMSDCVDPDCVVSQLCAEDCADGLDDNGDGRVDCTDPVCGAAPACAAVCPEETLAGPLPLQVVGSTFAVGAEYTATCGNGAPGADRTFAFVAPSAGTYTFDTVGSRIDTVLSVLEGCGGPVLGCNDDLPVAASASEVTVDLLAGQSVIVVVDGYDEDGDYVLNVR